MIMALVDQVHRDGILVEAVGLQLVAARVVARVDMEVKAGWVEVMMMINSNLLEVIGTRIGMKVEALLQEEVVPEVVWAEVLQAEAAAEAVAAVVEVPDHQADLHAEDQAPAQARQEVLRAEAEAVQGEVSGWKDLCS
jgi:hypothetical protein